MSRVAAALVAAAVVLAGCAVPGPSETTASVDSPAPLTEAQSELLAAMRFRNYATGTSGFSATLLSRTGDLTLGGWIDFTQRTGYARIDPVGTQTRTFLVLWDGDAVSVLDYAGVPDVSSPAEGSLLADTALPPVALPDGQWQTVVLDPSTSDLARFLTALLLLSDDRPENPLLLRQGGARYLGAEEIDNAPVYRFSGVPADHKDSSDADLGTQYWLDDQGTLVRFGIRLDGATLSTATFDPSITAPSPFPAPFGLSQGSNGE